MKYINAEKLYAKVDALMAHYAKAEKEMEDDVELSIFYQGKRKMCSEVINLINSLQQEQISGKIIETKGDIVAYNNGKLRVHSEFFAGTLGLHLGDKVHIIFIKE